MPVPSINSERTLNTVRIGFHELHLRSALFLWSLLLFFKVSVQLSAIASGTKVGCLNFDLTGSQKQMSSHFITKLGTIPLRRRQIFTIIDPYPPTIGIPAKCL